MPIDDKKNSSTYAYLLAMWSLSPEVIIIIEHFVHLLRATENFILFESSPFFGGGGLDLNLSSMTWTEVPPTFSSEVEW